MSEYDEVETTEPEEDDYVITDVVNGGYAVAEWGHAGYLADFDTRDEAEEFIRRRGNAEQFFPNVWIISDHGNASIVEGFQW